MLTHHPYLLAYIVSKGARGSEFIDDFYSSEKRQSVRRMVNKLRQQLDEQIKKG